MVSIRLRMPVFLVHPVRNFESNDFKVGELRNNATSGHISVLIYTIFGEILADSENSDFICYEIERNQNNSSW